jgi:hemerythrin
MKCIIKWLDIYTIDNQAIDNQHKKLFKIANEALGYRYDKNLSLATQKQKVKITIHQLIKYMNTHFKEEEKYMESINYNKIDEHKLKHDRFIKILNYIVTDSKCLIDLENRLVYLLGELFIEHVLNDDIDIVVWSKKS